MQEPLKICVVAPDFSLPKIMLTMGNVKYIPASLVQFPGCLKLPEYADFLLRNSSLFCGSVESQDAAVSDVCELFQHSGWLNSFLEASSLASSSGSSRQSPLSLCRRVGSLACRVLGQDGAAAALVASDGLDHRNCLQSGGVWAPQQNTKLLFGFACLYPTCWHSGRTQ